MEFLKTSKDLWYSRGRWLVSPYNFEEEVIKYIHLPDHVTLCDVTLREGEDAAGVVFTTEDKLKMAKKLDKIGIPIIECGWIWFKKCQEEVKVLAKAGLSAKIMTNVMNREEIDIASDCGADFIEFLCFPFPFSVSNVKYKTEEEIISRGVDLTKHAKDCGLMVRADMSLAPFGDLSFIKRFFKAVTDAGADQIYISDPGVCSPLAFKFLVSEIKKAISAAPLAVHIHNTLGLSTANALAAVEAGAEVVDAAVNGLGDQAGFVPLEEVAVNLTLLYKVKTGIRLDKLKELSLLCEKLTNYPISKNKPIVGDYAFSISFNPPNFRPDHWIMQTSFPIEPKLVGNKKVVFLGKYTDQYLLKTKMTELGIDVRGEFVQEIVEKIIKELESKKRVLNDNEILQIINEICGTSLRSFDQLVLDQG